jgi:hypothetical protein
VSELFDSLSRRRHHPGGVPERATAQRDSVLASMGYARPARRRVSRRVLALLAVAAVLLVAWAAWRAATAPNQHRSVPAAVAPGSSGLWTAPLQAPAIMAAMRARHAYRARISPRTPAAHYNLAMFPDETGRAARAIVDDRTLSDTAGPDLAAHAPRIPARPDALSRR